MKDIVRLEEFYEPMKTFLSFSKIETWLGCPLKYKYLYIDKLPQIQTVHMIFGKSLHESMAKFASAKMNKELTSLDDIINVFLENWKKEYPSIEPLENEEEWIERGKKIVKSYCRREALSDFSPKFIEKKFFLDLDENTRLNGIFDRVDIVDENPVIMEFKTHLNRELSLLQLKIYSFAYYTLYHKIPSKAILYSFETGEKVEIIPQKNDILLIKRFLQNVSREIQKGEFKGVPSAWNCRFCPAKNICSSYTSKKENKENTDPIG